MIPRYRLWARWPGMPGNWLVAVFHRGEGVAEVLRHARGLLRHNRVMHTVIERVEESR